MRHYKTVNSKTFLINILLILIGFGGLLLIFYRKNSLHEYNGLYFLYVVLIVILDFFMLYLLIKAAIFMKGLGLFNKIRFNDQYIEIKTKPRTKAVIRAWDDVEKIGVARVFDLSILKIHFGVKVVFLQFKDSDINFEVKSNKVYCFKNLNDSFVMLQYSRLLQKDIMRYYKNIENYL